MGVLSPYTRIEPLRDGGAPLNSHRVKLRWILGFYLLLSMVLLGFGASASFVRQERATGELVPSAGILGVIARRDGVVSRVFVRDGQSVHANDPLVAISVDTQLEDGKEVGWYLAKAADAKAQSIDDQISANRTERDQSLADVMVRREALDREIALLAGSRDVAEARVKAAEGRIARLAPLVQKGFISSVQSEQWQDALATGKLNLAEIQQRQSDARKQRDELLIEEKRLRAKEAANRSVIAGTKAELYSAQASALGQHELVLRAERSGRVTAMRARVGAPVKTGDRLAIVLPSGSQLLAQIWVPSRAMGFVRPGNRVKLMFDAFPYTAFGTADGRIVEVASAPTDFDRSARRHGGPILFGSRRAQLPDRPGLRPHLGSGAGNACRSGNHP